MREYLVWQIYERRLDWFALHDDEYELVQPDAKGVLRSHFFPGLHLHLVALLAGDLARVLATLQAGRQGPEHAAFIAQLQAAAPRS